ncbi:hypothetical protein DMN91_005318 [Ooceraea biroi]|uniref:Cap-specific mRNA (nucleoside-2'-O-)-methyltransferase 1 n=1 Tax=Ooceraea biroi TaxID=2015173 RepID=A0A026VVC6_OOCBI|nr:cap-specific mRNA (nucleoside-2'-O-)-methyltransferase 1 [Ooceraea biroi]EZA47486.1 Cap-specific mRNA (nucleoside-2'-O-)-methyltransferase [Ooceraea biroi]RLU23040.1 hypothetical protein DMN91_005318 [Ooceraea biroi]
MESSTDDDSVLGSEDVKLRTGDSFDGYSQHHGLSDAEKNPHYSELALNSALPSFNDNDCYSYPKRKREMYENFSSSSSDNEFDQQYGTASKYDEVNTSQSMNTFEAKKRKLNSAGGTICSMSTEQYNETIEQESSVHVNESKSDASHLSKAERMMTNMGYKPGKGLGKHDQGRVEPVEAVKQRGRRGLGHFVPGLTEASLKWDPQEEEVKAMEDIEWLQNIHPNVLASDDLANWIKLGPKKHTIDDEATFCSSEILEQVLKSKTIFDKLDKVEMRKARTRSNPYETIRSAGYLNRAAVKMANINRACNFMFTDQKSLHPNELLYFADVCAGPGGFSEYVLSRKKWHAKGFGFTLKNENDFTLDEFFAGPCETFHPFYGSKDNGDVFDPVNQEEFRSLVMKHTYNKGVHFMMSDGGFSVEGQENIQEILSKQLYLCQCLVALMILRPGGHFVTKLFDLFTPFSAGLVYLMYRCFDSVSIFKPNSSRPANSERYLICKRKKPDTQAVMEYLSQVNHLLLKKNDNKDVTQLVPLDELEADTLFVTYLRNSNETLGRKQIVGLLKIAAFCEDPTLTEPKQAAMRKECLEYWDIPNKTRVRPQNVKPQDKIREILGNSIRLLGCDATKLTNDNVKSTVLNQPYDWYCMPCGSGPYIEEEKAVTFYLGLGRRKVFRYVKGGKWDSIGDVKIELPRDTLVYAELVYEAKWTGKYFSKTRALHILDAYMLGGEDVSKRYLSDRYRITKKFCDALWKPAPNDHVCVRAKERFMLGPDIEKKLRITQRRVKGMSIALEFPKNPLECDDKDDMEPLYLAPNSILFLRSTAHPWSRHLSQKTLQFYVFNKKTETTEYEIRNGIPNRPPEAEASFEQAFEGRIIWHWPNNTGDDKLSMDSLVKLIKNSLQKI